MVANNNNYKVSKNKHTVDEDKNKQIHSQIKIHNEHLKNVSKIEKYKTLNTMGHKTDMNIVEIEKYKKPIMTEHKKEYNHTLVNQTINIFKSNEGVTNLKTPYEKG